VLGQVDAGGAGVGSDEPDEVRADADADLEQPLPGGSGEVGVLRKERLELVPELFDGVVVLPRPFRRRCMDGATRLGFPERADACLESRRSRRGTSSSAQV
jgi:hypothetical protein